MEIIYLGLILFILGIGAIIVWDKYKDQISNTVVQRGNIVRGDMSRSTITKKRPSKSVFKEETDYVAELHRQKAVRSAEQQVNQLIAQVKARAAAGQKSITITEGVHTQTLTVNQLLKKLEDMKKKI